MSKRLKILTISDHPLSPTGVGSQSKYVFEALLKSDKFDVISIGGAMHHSDYRPVQTEEWKERWTIIPQDSYSNQDTIRSIIRMERPDALWIMTDPRFFTWLFDIEAEIRPLVPLVWYTVWDDKPVPMFNKPYYLSCDALLPISKLTEEVVREIVPDVFTRRIGHAVDPNIFKIIPEEQVLEFRKNRFIVNGKPNMDRFIVFFNSRNAIRKNAASAVYWFNSFLKKVGKDKAVLLMHTNPLDEVGTNLEILAASLGLTKGEVMFSREHIDPTGLAMLYNMADVTVLPSTAEGFGLSISESLMCGTPAIGSNIGGIQEQISDGKEQFGVAIEPVSKLLIGDIVQCPFIFQENICEKDFVDALEKMYNMTREERKELGKRGHNYIDTNYNFAKFEQTWVDTMLEINEKFGSWETRKGYTRFEQFSL